MSLDHGTSSSYNEPTVASFLETAQSKDPSAVDQVRRILRERAVVECARRGQYSRIIDGSCGTTLTSRSIAGLASGIGFAIPAMSTYYDARFSPTVKKRKKKHTLNSPWNAHADMDIIPNIRIFLSLSLSHLLPLPAPRRRDRPASTRLHRQGSRAVLLPLAPRWYQIPKTAFNITQPRASDNRQRVAIVCPGHQRELAIIKLQHPRILWQAHALPLQPQSTHSSRWNQ